MSDRLPPWRRARRWFWYMVARAMLAGVAVMPDRFGRAGCRQLSYLAWRWRRRDRELAGRNLAVAYPEATAAWREALLRQSAGELGENLHTGLTLPRLAARDFVAVNDRPGPDGRLLVETLQALQREGCGVIVATAHLGCWELLAAWLAARLAPTAVVTGTVRNPAVDRLLQDRRRALGLEVLARDRGARPLLRALDRGAVVGVLLDQNTRAVGAWVPFFGRPAPTPLGLLRLACRRKVPIVPAVMVREDGRWVARHEATIRAGEATDPLVLAAACNGALEALIRRNPAQWAWFHDRWGLRAAAERP